MIKHATASVFLFAQAEAEPEAGDGWRIGLIRHPRFARWMLPGGHVEPEENPAEAALREVREETGLDATLVLPYSGVLPDNPAARVPVPLWITEHPVPAETRLPAEHLHVDHLYLAVAPAVTAPSELPFRWYALPELEAVEMFPDARAGVKLLFPLVDALVAGQAG